MILAERTKRRSGDARLMAIRMKRIGGINRKKEQWRASEGRLETDP
jgi:hypothetical protein